MSLRVYSPRLVWDTLRCADGPAISKSLDKALREWEGTPYESGQRFKQRGADCIGAIFGVVDQIDGRSRAAYPGMPQDTAMHNRATAVVAVRELLRRYAPAEKVEGLPGEPLLVEPGDVLVTGAPGGGPGHVEMVGARKNELWHALPGAGFHQGGWGLLNCQVLYAVYRIMDKERWAQ